MSENSPAEVAFLCIKIKLLHSENAERLQPSPHTETEESLSLPFYFVPDKAGWLSAVSFETSVRF